MGVKRGQNRCVVADKDVSNGLFERKCGSDRLF